MSPTNLPVVTVYTHHRKGVHLSDACIKILDSLVLLSKLVRNVFTIVFTRRLLRLHRKEHL